MGLDNQANRPLHYDLGGVTKRNFYMIWRHARSDERQQKSLFTPSRKSQGLEVAMSPHLSLGGSTPPKSFHKHKLGREKKGEMWGSGQALQADFVLQCSWLNQMLKAKGIFKGLLLVGGFLLTEPAPGKPWIRQSALCRSLPSLFMSWNALLISVPTSQDLARGSGRKGSCSADPSSSPLPHTHHRV